jgi:Ras-related protein Rab-4B
MNKLFVRSVSSRESFNALNNWLTDARSLASPDLIIILVGNKRDLNAEREVSTLEAATFAQENGLSFYSLSSNPLILLLNLRFNVS